MQAAVTVQHELGRSRKPKKAKATQPANGKAAAKAPKKGDAAPRRNGRGGLKRGYQTLNTAAPSAMPSVVSRNLSAGEVVSDDGQIRADAHSHLAPLSEIVAAIREHHRQRETFFRAELRLNNQIKAILRRGRPRTDALPSTAATSSEEESEPTKTDTPTLSSPDFSSTAHLALEQSMLYLRKFRMHHQRLVIKYAQQLPVWPWVESVPGFGAMGLGQIVGEAGDIKNYPTVSKLWKRMGLAVIRDPNTGEDEAQRRCKDKAKAELHGFNPRRRSIMYSIGDALVKSNQDRNTKVPGEYRSVYLTRKAYERGNLPDATNMKVHRRAQRYMEKRILKRLWQRWRNP